MGHARLHCMSCVTTNFGRLQMLQTLLPLHSQLSSPAIQSLLLKTDLTETHLATKKAVVV